MKYPICNKCPERAPNIFGYPFIFCWRCTGLIVGFLVGLFLSVFINKIGLYGFLLLVPVAVDGGLQYGFNIMSNNYRRFITGFLGGLISLINI